MTLSLTLLATLPGCALVDTYRHCGIAGCTNDSAITARVHGLLRSHPSLEAPNRIDVQTLGGVVYLYGLVDTEEQRGLATDVASEADGVTRVVNAIGIDNEGR